MRLNRIEIIKITLFDINKCSHSCFIEATRASTVATWPKNVGRFGFWVEVGPYLSNNRIHYLNFMRNKDAISGK